MSRRHEPNASHYSARYWERKRAAERARDAAMGPQPCLRCPEPQAPGSLFCPAHAEQHRALLESRDFDAALALCQRTYWPPA